MKWIKRAVKDYWIIYYLVYVSCVGFYLWRYWQSLQEDDYIYLLAAIFGASVGIALLVAIISEVIGRMVLLIPKAVKDLIDRGRREERARWREARKRFGVDVDGVQTLSFTPEVEEFLSSESKERE